jgi:transcriptional regulator with XRE-family HTH domain
MINRISLIIKTKNLTASKFADKIGVQRSSISHILSGRNKPGLELIQKTLKNFPEISSDWLISGLGEMNKSSDNINKNADFIKKDDSEHQNNIKPNLFSDKKLNKEKNIEKIVVLYSDKTFIEYKHTEES